MGSSTLRSQQKCKARREEHLEWDPAPSVSNGLHCYSDFKTLFTMLPLRFVGMGTLGKKKLSFLGTFTVPPPNKILKRVKICRAFDLHLECSKFRVSMGLGILATILYWRVPCQVNGNWKCCASTLTDKPGKPQWCWWHSHDLELRAGHRIAFKKWSALQKRGLSPLNPPLEEIQMFPVGLSLQEKRFQSR